MLILVYSFFRLDHVVVVCIQLQQTHDFSSRLTLSLSWPLPIKTCFVEPLNTFIATNH